MTALAPIVLFVFNRPVHTARTLRALKNNQLAGESKLYIFCDGPKENASLEQLEKIKQVRNICNEEKWCGEIVVVSSEKNKGLANSVIDGVTKVINEHGKAIVLEDDIETNPLFLTFMNNGLDFYENDNEVGGISSHSFTDDAELDDFYFLPLTSSWGWATWKRVWDKVNFNTTEIYKSVLESPNFKNFNFGNYPYFEMLDSQSKGLVDSWAIRFYANNFMQNKLFLFPRLAYSTNIGFDHSGTHCDDANYFANQTHLGDQYFSNKIEIKLKEKNIGIIKNFFKQQINLMNNKKKQNTHSLHWAKTKIKRLVELFKINKG